MNTTEAALTAYFNSGRVVCPYARSTRRVFTADEGLSLVTVGRSVSALLVGEVAVVYATDWEGLAASRSFEQARWWAYETHRYLQWLIDWNRVETHGVTVLINENASRTATLRPYLRFGAATFYAIGMGPQYPERHPRYAPHLCLVIVNEAQIRAVPLPDRDPIRRAMIERTGVVYSADEVWLPLEPEAAVDPGKESLNERE